MGAKAEKIFEMSKKDLDNLYKRIGNTLKLASDSPYEAERETAMKLAQKMMMEYSITLEQIQLSTGEKMKKEAIKEYVEIHEKETKWWVRDLYWSLAVHFRCKAIENSKLHGKYGCMGLIGLREDVQICTEVLKFAKLSIIYFSECYVINEVNRLNNMPMNERPLIYQKWVKIKDFTGAKNDYVRGYINGLGIALKKQEEENKKEWGLVLVMDEVVTKYIKEQKLGTAKNMKITTSDDEKHYKKGKEDGTNYVHKKAMIG